MTDKEHPAATAGRFLRAAGDAIQKELERRSAESEEKKKAEQASPAGTAASGTTAASSPAAAQAAAKTTAQAKPPPQGKAPPADPTAAAEAAAARRAARQKPPLEPKPIFDRLLWLVFVVGLIALALSGLQIQVLAGESAQTVIRLVLGIPLVIVALLVLTNWGRANERIVARIFKMWGLDHPTTKSGRFARRFAKDALTLVGILLLAVAAFQLMSAAVK